MALTGFESLDGCVAAAAMPGISTLEYVPIDELDTSSWPAAIIDAAYNQQSAAGVADWYALPFIGGTGSWVEDQVESPQGDHYKINISAFMAADTHVVRGELSRMRQHRYLVRITRNGQTWILGTPTMPLRFESKFDSGSEGGDNRGHRCIFTGVSLQKSPGFVPVF
jgi:hypothetical protein